MSAQLEPDSRLATILQLREASEPWATRRLDRDEEHVLVRALISVSLAFAKFVEIDAIALAALVQKALDAQQETDDPAEIDQAAIDVLETLGYE